jgi:hypothetical protein
MRVITLKNSLILGISLLANIALAQVDIQGQLVQRAEYRHGYGKLIPDSVDGTAFISQRVRLQFTYATKHVKWYASVQDIRTWGNTAQLNTTDNLLSLHEGWAEIPIDSNWSVKVGRQELVYDNSRFLGNVDWSLQARSHDFALVKFARQAHKLHVGGGYNQDAEALFGGDYYKTINQYKAAQMLWYNYKKQNFELSFLFWNNGKQDTTYGKRQVRYSQTIGLPTIKYNFTKNNIISAFGYYQTGKDVNNKNLDAYDVSLQYTNLLQLNQVKNNVLKTIVGFEMLSGKNSNDVSNNNRSFSPLYGTNHMYNGYMDYFYVSGRFENGVGLNDMYIKAHYDANKKWFMQADLHYFLTNAKVYKATEELTKQLGTELDFSAGVVLNEEVSLQLGYSQMFAANTLKYMQSAKASNTQNWSYIMLIIRPKSDKKFIGLAN